ncbi:hypothetical protein BH11PSE9_BH11PSE9_08370 [soil metagenome]
MNSVQASLRMLIAGICLVHGVARAEGPVIEPAPAPKAASNLLSQANEVELALSAGPQHLRAEAAVYVFGEGGYVQVKAGSNGFNCLVNRDGYQAGDQTLRPTCWDAEGSATILPVMLRVGELLAHGKSADEVERDIDLGFSEGRYASPQKAGIAYMLLGDVQIDPETQAIGSTSFPPHYMIYAPGVSNADIGISRAALEDHFDLPFVYSGYSGGTRTGYIIVLAQQAKRRIP